MIKIDFKMSDVQDGDGVCVYGTDFVGDVVSTVEGGNAPSHIAGVVLTDIPDLVEMLQEGCKLSPLTKYWGKNKIVIIRYKAGLTAQQKSDITNWWLAGVNKVGYSNWEDIGIGLVTIASAIGFFGWKPFGFLKNQPNHFDQGNCSICSRYYADAYSKFVQNLVPGISNDYLMPVDDMRSPLMQIIACIDTNGTAWC